LAFDSACHS